MNSPDNGNVPETGEYPQPANSLSRFYEVEPRSRAKVEVSAKTNPGTVRPNNEDNYLAVRRYRGRDILATSLPRELLDCTEDYAYLFAVADGMGGHSFGEIASLIALTTGWDLGAGEIKWTMKMNPREMAELDEKAQAFFRLIDETIRAEVRESPQLAGMGTTLTICYSTGDQLFVMHAGDSRAYLHRDGALRRLTRDHNLAQVLVDAGKANPESWEARRVRHMLTNALGGKHAAVEVEIHHERLRDGDRLLLCSDGLNGMMSDEEIAAILNQNPASSDACSALMLDALHRGANDNVTVIVARYTIERDAAASALHRGLAPD